MIKQPAEFLKSLALLGHGIISLGFQAGQIIQQLLFRIQTQITTAEHLGILHNYRLQLRIFLFQLLCTAVSLLGTVAIPIDYFIRIMKIKILLPQYSGQEI